LADEFGIAGHDLVLGSGCQFPVAPRQQVAEWRACGDTRLTTHDSLHLCGPLPILLGAKTLETQIVVAVRADLPPVPESRGMAVAEAARVPNEPVKTRSGV
jgi:hypothetical protein